MHLNLENKVVLVTGEIQINETHPSIELTPSQAAPRASDMRS
jgi:hypothetical protein